MKTRMVILALLLLLLSCPSGVLAGSWLGHYQVEVTISPLGGNAYNFTYDVTNIDQGGYMEGLDCFVVQVPLTAAISNITDPPPYYSSEYGAEWRHIPGFSDPMPDSQAVLQTGYQWFLWLGYQPLSIYPQGTTATFSFDAGNVVIGQHQGIAVTYLAAYPNSIWYEDVIQGPAAVPLPGTLALLGPGLLGLAVFGRRRIFKR